MTVRLQHTPSASHVSLIKLVLIAIASLYSGVGFSSVNQVTITTDSQHRYIKANGLPDHEHGQFPNRGNPHRVSSQSYQFRVPLHPKLTGRIQPTGRHNFGVAINGVPFDPGSAEYWKNDRSTGWRMEALNVPGKLGIDHHNAHVQPTGAYHYHGLPHGLLVGSSSSQHSPLIGYAADGYPIYARYGYRDSDNPRGGIRELTSSYVLKTGNRKSNEPSGRYDGTYNRDYDYRAGHGDLDECNGRTGITPEYPGGTYYYVVTTNYPYVPRCFRGTPDDSFRKQGMGRQRPGSHPQGRPRHDGSFRHHHPMRQPRF